jgi:murein DD-endopeptidase MepM/ murein hydrolase activator NlpD
VLTEARVAPERAFFGARPVRVAFRFRADGPLDLRVEIRRRDAARPARRWLLLGASPIDLHRLRWDGHNTKGRAARVGTYRVSVGPRTGRLVPAGRFMLHGHFYPVRGAHWFRGPVGQFGAPRSGGRIHEGFDVNAACGTPLVAARAGRVRYSAYDPVLYGHRVIIRGRQTRRDYWYAHLLPGVPVHEGDQVRTGQRIGGIGATGNARAVGCHLHFEIRARGVPIDPEPLLTAWDGWS